MYMIVYFCKFSFRRPARLLLFFVLQALEFFYEIQLKFNGITIAHPFSYKYIEHIT